MSGKNSRTLRQAVRSQSWPVKTVDAYDQPVNHHRRIRHLMQATGSSIEGPSASMDSLCRSR